MFMTPKPSLSHSLPPGLSALLRFEREWLAARAPARSRGPRWWLAPQAEAVEGFQLLTVGAERRGDGCVRCDLGLWPVSDGSLDEIVLQHVIDPSAASMALLAESVRSLADGGCLWLFGGNPLSPCSPAWRRDKSSGWSTSAPGRAGALLGRLGLTPLELVRLGAWLPGTTAMAAGPHWTAPLRSAYVIRAEKRVARVIALPRPVRAPAAPASPLVTTFSATARGANGR